MSEEELKRLKELLANESTPPNVKKLIGVYVDSMACTMQANTRNEYLANKLREVIKANNTAGMKMFGYLCPNVPNISLITPDIKLEGEIEQRLTKLAYEEGWYLLTTLEAAAFQKGVSIGRLLHTAEDALVAITVASIGQELREELLKDAV